MTAPDTATDALPPVATPAPWRLRDWLLLASVVSVALIIRFNAIDSHPSADEVWHLALSTGDGSPVGRYADDTVYPDVPGEPATDAASIASVWTSLGQVAHPPLYLLALRLWRDAFGPGDAAAHACSILAATIGIAFVTAAARDAMSRPAALLVGLIASVAPVQIYFAQEIRGYAMLTGIASTAIWLATRIEVGGPTRGRAAALAATTLPLMLLHYFAIGTTIGIAAYGILRLRARPRRAFVAALSVAAIIYLLAWGPFVRAQLSAVREADAYLRVETFDFLGEAWWSLSVPARLLVEGVWMDQARYGWPSVAIGTACLVLPWLLARRYPPLAPWAAMLCGTIVAIVAADAARSTWLTQLIRYLASASPAVPLLLVGLPWAIGRVSAYVAGGLALITLALAPRPPLAVIADSPYFGDMAAWAVEHVPPGDALLLRSGDGVAGHLADLQLMSLQHERSLFPRAVVKLTRPPSPAMRAALPDQGWLFLPGQFALPADPVIGSLEVRQAWLLPRQGLVVCVGLHPANTRPARTTLEGSQRPGG